MYECINISDLKLEEMVGKNIALAPTSFDAMFELRLLMNKCGYTMFKQPAISKSKIDAVSRCKFDLSNCISADKDNKILFEAALKYINYDSFDRICIYIESDIRHWQSSIEYYQEKDFTIIEVTIDNNYKCFFDEQLIMRENKQFGRKYSDNELSNHIESTKKYRFGNYLKENYGKSIRTI